MERNARSRSSRERDEIEISQKCEIRGSRVEAGEIAIESDGAVAKGDQRRGDCRDRRRRPVTRSFLDARLSPRERETDALLADRREASSRPAFFLAKRRRAGSPLVTCGFVTPEVDVTVIYPVRLLVRWRKGGGIHV